MPGRNDFGVLRSSFLSDERAHRAAELFAAKGLASEALSFSAVAGVVTQLGLWAMRETDDGVLPGDGVAAVHQATMMPRSTCRDVIALLIDAGLLRASDGPDGGLYLVGFRDCYHPILERRESNRESNRKRLEDAAQKRAKRGTRKPSATRQRDVSNTSATRPADVEAHRAVPAVPFRAVPERTEPTPPPRGGVSAAPIFAATALPDLSESDRLLLVWGMSQVRTMGSGGEPGAMERQLATNAAAGFDDYDLADKFVRFVTIRWPKEAQDFRRTDAMRANADRRTA